MVPLCIFKKNRHQWEIEQIEAPYTCLSIIPSQDRISLDSKQIASIVVNSIQENMSIPIKSLIAEIQNHYGYFVMY